jgi:putative SOS response-associated peptidase YedK
MPLIPREDDFSAWLDAKAGATSVAALMQPYTASAMECFPVSKLVNSAGNESAACVERVETVAARPASPQFELF